MHWTVHLAEGPRRVNHAAAAVGDFIYTFGGYCSGKIYTYRCKQPIDVHVLNTINLQWHQLPKPQRNKSQYSVTPFQRYGHTAVAYGKNIYIWGGRNDETACNKLFCFDTETNSWSCPKTSGTIPCSRDGHSACVIGHHMYVFGGFDKEFERYSQDVYALDLHTMIWEYIVTKGSPPEFRDFHTGTAIGNRMYVFGGRSDRSGLYGSKDFYPNSMIYLDMTNMEWCRPRIQGEPPIGRRSHSAFVYQGCIFIFGGYNGILFQHFNDLHRFCPKTNTWSPVPTLGEPPNERRRQVCVVIKDRMFLFGGTSPNPDCFWSTYSVNLDETSDPQEVRLMDHDDLHILDLSPSLKTLSMLAVTNYEITDASIPEDLKWELNIVTANKWMPPENNTLK